MKITNPTDKTIKVQVKGISYEVSANDSISNVPKEHAIYWKEQLHNFIEVSEEFTGETAPIVETVPEATEDVVTEVTEEVVESPDSTQEEVVEEKPKKRSKFKK